MAIDHKAKLTDKHFALLNNESYRLEALDKAEKYDQIVGLYTQWANDKCEVHYLLSDFANDVIKIIKRMEPK